MGVSALSNRKWRGLSLGWGRFWLTADLSHRRGPGLRNWGMPLFAQAAARLALERGTGRQTSPAPTCSMPRLCDSVRRAEDTVEAIQLPTSRGVKKTDCRALLIRRPFCRRL